jgi:hypothetical protein
MTADPQQLQFDLYKLYLETAEKVSDRRAQANAWMLSVNSAVVALYGYLEGADGPKGHQAWPWAIPLAGALVCLTWAALLASYRKLNSAKFTVLHEIEAGLPLQPFKRERDVYKASGRWSFARIERGVPWTFIVLYMVMVLFALSGP